MSNIARLLPGCTILRNKHHRGYQKHEQQKKKYKATFKKKNIDNSFKNIKYCLY